MQGPFDPGTSPSLMMSPTHPWSVPGDYSVSKPFRDADGDLHPVGETWWLLGSQFSKFDNEVTVFVRKADATEWRFTLGWTQDRQQEVIERWSQFVGAESRKHPDP